MTRALAVALVVFFLFLGTAATRAQAADVKCLCPLAIGPLLKELAPEFERASSHKLAADLATLGVNADRVAKGVPADVVVLLPRQIDELEKQGRLLTGTRMEVARVGYGVAVRKGGASKPDLVSVDALKRTLLAAKSVSYGDPAGGGPAGIYIAGLMDRLGLADLRSKTRLVQNAELVIPAVANGDADIGFTLASSGKASTAVDFIPLPTEVQNYTVYVAAALADSKQAAAAKTLLGFLASPAAREAMKTKGFEPPTMW
jgi:molybdate transport system substrate-binding protein